MEDTNQQLIDLPWLDVANGEIGVHEISGPDASNARIDAYNASVHVKGDDSENAWCSAFVNFCMECAGIEGTDRPNARSWLDWGVPLMRPRAGCVVVFTRPEAGPANGHVGFWISEVASIGQTMVLGGNEHNSVRVAPYSTARVLGWRWPTGFRASESPPSAS